MFSRQEAFLILNSLLEDIPFSCIKSWLEVFGSAENILRQTEKSLCAVNGVGVKPVVILARWKDRFDLSQELKLVEKEKVSLLFLGEAGYPKVLQNLHCPPLVIYCRGGLAAQDEQAIAVVGARAATPYGKDCAWRLSKELAQQGWTVVSGLAYGIDTAAHAGALESKGRTVAVLGQGLAAPLYPPENEKLARRIAEQGAVLSEFPMAFSPQPRNFPRRNRVIAGLSQGVVVVEAARKSGALITADYALDQGKTVFAVPGRIDLPTSEGTHALLQQGAKLVTHTRDILEEFGSPFGLPLDSSNEKKSLSAGFKLNEEEKALLSRLSSDEKQLETLLTETALPLTQVSSVLFSLEMKNLVKQLPGQYYVKL